MPSLKCGVIIRVRLDPLEGSEQAGECPAVVISPDVINEHSPMMLIAALTSQKTERMYPFEVLVEPPKGGLTQRSKVLLMQLRAVDKRRVKGSDRINEDVKGKPSRKARATSVHSRTAFRGRSAPGG
jgi:mRNA interferase MazF